MSRALSLVVCALVASLSGCSGDDEINLLSSGGAAGSNGSCAEGCPDGEEPHCDSASGRCVECLEQAHCSLGQVCDLASGECLEACSAIDPCTSGDRPICDADRQVCVQCQAETDCDEERPRCNLGTGFCVECLSGSDCVDPTEPVCKPLEHECSTG